MRVATPFYQRPATEFAADASLMDYSDFQAEMDTLFASFASAENVSADNVAKTVFTAVTDESHTLRYIAGPDIEPLIALRNSKSDQEYNSLMRNQLIPNAFENK